MKKISDLTKEYIKKKSSEGLNTMSVPVIKKVVLTSGISGQFKEGKKIEVIKQEIKKITGQIPIVVKAKVSCDSFHIRKNDIVAIKVTLRKEKMYSFLERTLFFVLPRMNNFKGFKKSSISRGTFNFGVYDYTYFYEIDRKTSPLNRFGFHVHVSTSSKNDKDTLELLQYLNVPCV